MNWSNSFFLATQKPVSPKTTSQVRATYLKRFVAVVRIRRCFTDSLAQSVQNLWPIVLSPATAGVKRVLELTTLLAHWWSKDQNTWKNRAKGSKKYFTQRGSRFQFQFVRHVCDTTTFTLIQRVKTGLYHLQKYRCKCFVRRWLIYDAIVRDWCCHCIFVIFTILISKYCGAITILQKICL